MKYPEYSFPLKVDVTNPGHFFACCGLLELANRLWPGAEGCFDTEKLKFTIYCQGYSASLEKLIKEVTECEVTGLNEAESKERGALEEESRQLKKQNQKLTRFKEKRRKKLGEMARKGAIRLGSPFDLDLNWWQIGDEDTAAPKTWAGNQEIHKVFRSAQDALGNISNVTNLFYHHDVMRMPKEYQKSKGDQKKTIEPFYFDARRFAHALDTGFSLDVQSAETQAYPAVEMLSLIGLQRFRPTPMSNKWAFEYMIWKIPLSVAVASVVNYCTFLFGDRYCFKLLFRDDQKRYKAFAFSNPIGG